ncbi:MAG TPA: excisionase family DNA-binding protein [Actinocrinis sp.]|uniref:helix-turn-helix domain-containing protein n=1 Tax=Actinocrinis sp. TaxID=1920516 RepID=UPI002DDCD3BE|nr:excisionase family DNA-binding protein [Actinocrinis sp.]HEV2346743.1 excisionase family DNA-binding protein [Actinocrinis sp.]
MSPIASVGSLKPGEVNAEQAERARRRITDYLAAHPDGPNEVSVLVEGDPDDALVVPRPVVEMIAHVLGQLAAGRGVSVIPSHAELTTQQAADMLNVSRPFLIGLLESGEIPYRTVGRHRRITFEALMEFKRHDDLKRRAAADELADLSQELGLY